MQARRVHGRQAERRAGGDADADDLAAGRAPHRLSRHPRDHERHHRLGRGARRRTAAPPRRDGAGERSDGCDGQRGGAAGKGGGCAHHRRRRGPRQGGLLHRHSRAPTLPRPFLDLPRTFPRRPTAPALSGWRAASTTRRSGRRASSTRAGSLPRPFRDLSSTLPRRAARRALPGRDRLLLRHGGQRRRTPIPNWHSRRRRSVARD